MLLNGINVAHIDMFEVVSYLKQHQLVAASHLPRGEQSCVCCHPSRASTLLQCLPRFIEERTVVSKTLISYAVRFVMLKNR